MPSTRRCSCDALGCCPEVAWVTAFRGDDRLDAPRGSVSHALFVDTSGDMAHGGKPKWCTWAFERCVDQQSEQIVVRFEGEDVPECGPTCDGAARLLARSEPSQLSSGYWNQKKSSI
jgi:hypothetical protein